MNKTGIDIQPTRDDINEKINSEAKRVFDTATEDDLTGFHSEVEVKYKLRDELINISMTDEMIQALNIKDDVLDDAYRFYIKENKDNQAFLAVFQYLEKTEHEYLAQRVLDRATLEYEDYLNEVKKKTPTQIIEEAYKITTLKDILIGLDPYTVDLSTEQLKALYALENPLWDIYHEWQQRDITHMDDIAATISDIADENTVAADESDIADEVAIEDGEGYEP